MNKKQLILDRVDGILRTLSEPISQNELEHGWNENSRLAMYKFYKTLKEDLLNNVDVTKKIEYLTIVRGLDSWGIEEGDIFQESVRISSEIRSLKT